MNAHPIGTAVALSSHGRQLSIQEVSGFVNALGYSQKYKQTHYIIPFFMIDIYNMILNNYKVAD